MTTYAIIIFSLALLPYLIYTRNIRLFQRPSMPPEGVVLPPVSVLIPARNEEASIAKAIDCIQKSVGLDWELIVLDDQSTDATATVVSKYALADNRIRLETAPPLPKGWAGKQHACWVLSQLAKHNVICFLDADVRLAPQALAASVYFLETSNSELVSGFPQQETITFFEQLILPLMQWLIICYLPLSRMRATNEVGLGAGCGQWFVAKKEAYMVVGGHEAVKASFHDGVKLPRAFRQKGYHTDIFDGAFLAKCRMYTHAKQVWFGLAKNAHEGLGGPIAIWLWTFLLLGGHVLPGLSLLATCRDPSPLNFTLFLLLALACGLSFWPRWHCAARFQASFLGAALHPLGVLLLLSIQWFAFGYRLLGVPIGWKGRPQPRLQSE